ncbi:MAG: glycoside hydrolase family 43 protein [Oscillospiraceae bacterium]|nr:glycoside hydrolase family 43 protein [Oscillospiraceae bacterium]
MPNIQSIQIRDPFIFQEGGALYLFGSTDPDIWRAAGVGFDVYKSSGSLTEWEGPYPAFRPPENFWSTRNFWAPEVFQYNGAYYMFATFLPDAGKRGTAILRSESPPGPFLPWSFGPVTPPAWECLDGTLYIDEAKIPWMVFCHEWQQVGDGKICMLRLTDDLKAAASCPELLFTASEAPWAKPLKNRAPGSYVTDGPFLHRTKDGTLLMLWSSFGETGNYCIGAAVSETGTLKGPWRQSDEPVYSADGGHGMLFTAPEGGLYLAIHTPNQTPNERAVFAGLRWDGDRLLPTGEVIP